MMKKILSIILTVCMLFSLVIVPVTVNAEGNAQATGETFDYYKWDFSEDKLYTDYDDPVKPDGVTYDFKAVNNSGNHSFAYANINGEDALRIRASKSNNNIMFTPLKEDGTPFQLEAGKEYVASITYYISRLGAAWSRPHFEIYTTVDGSVPRTSLQKTVGEGESATTEYLFFDPATERVMNAYSSLYANKEIGYFDSGRTLNNANYYDAHSMTETDGVKAFNLTLDSKGNNTNYGDVAVAVAGKESKYSYTTDIVLATDEVLADEWNVTKNADGTYKYNGRNYTNFFGFSLPPAYGSYWIEGYDENAFENAQDGEGNWYHRAYSEYYVTELVVYEKGCTGAVLHVGDTVTQVEGNAGDPIALEIPAAPEGKYFVAWYTDAEFTTPVTEAQTLVEGAPVDYYARFEEYGTYFRDDFSSNSHMSPAIQMSTAGYQYATHGYSFKNKYANVTVDAKQTPVWTKDDLINDLTRNNLPTEYPDCGVISTYSDRTWGMPGNIMFVNADGTLFTPKAGAKYKITYRYRSILNNGTNPKINVVYGLKHSAAAVATTDNTTHEVKTLAYYTVEGKVPEWTERSEIVTIPAAGTDHVPALGLDSDGVTKVAIDTDGDGTNDAYAFTVVDFDYVEVEKIPTAKVNFLTADGSVHTAAATVEVGAKISYPALSASLNYDHVWSLDANKYVPVPETLTEEKDITVYAIQSPVLSFENYPISSETNASPLYNAALPYDNEFNAQVSVKDAYTGTHSMRLRDVYIQFIATKPADWDTAWTKYYEYNAETEKWTKLAGTAAPEFVANKYGLWRNGTESGMTVIKKFDKQASLSFSYKISFKYKATENNKGSSTLNARVFPNDNIWWGTVSNLGTFTFPAGATNGWQTGEMYVTASNVTHVVTSSGGQMKTSAYQFVLDLKWDGKGTQYNKEIFIDDVTIEENYVNTPKLYIHVGDEVTTVTEGLTAGGTFTPPTVEVPANKYFMGWIDASGNELTEFKMPAANLFGEYHIYAKLGTYPDNVTIDVTGATQPKLKGYSTFTSATINETGWASVSYTAEGVKLEKALGGANKFDPAKATSGKHDQTSSLSHYVAIADDKPIGTQMNGGWIAATQYILRDKDGNAIMAKPNTKYAITVNYEKIGQGSQALRVAIGKSAAKVTTGETESVSTFMNNSTTYGIADGFDKEVTGENNTHTYYVTTGTFAEGDVPVIGLQYTGNSFIVERVADANGVESYVYNQDGKTYYPYKIVSRPGVLVKSVDIIEIDSGKVAVTYKTYEKGVGYSAVVKENVTGAALDADTHNYDPKWYNSETHITMDKVVTTYPSANATYYNATYGQLNPAASTYVTGDGKKNGGEKEWTFENALYDGKYALHIGGAKVAIDTGDVETYMTGVNVEQGHTYKVSFKYKATAAHGKFGFSFCVCQGDNFWSASNREKATMSIAAGEATNNWITKDVYFTIDLTGTNSDENETGVDYNVERDYRKALQMVFTQDAFEAGNDLYFADIEVVDLGEVITKGGASVLNADAAEEAGMQAMRFYFDYKTIDGSQIIIGEETLTVVERGFLYRNGKVAKDGTVASLYDGTASQKTEGFNNCWAYDEATQMMKFSTYVTGFKKENDTRKLEVNAYIIVELADGSRYTIYSASTNRSVAGVQGLGDPSDSSSDGNINDGQ